MTSVVAICNRALANLGAPEINTLIEASTEAQACKRFYQTVFDEILQGFPWTFAGHMQSLAPVANPKAGEWSFAYQLPNDFLSFRFISGQSCEYDILPGSFNPHLRHRHDIEGQTLYCSLSPCFLRYTRKIKDPTILPPLAQAAVEWALTTRITMPLTRDIRMRRENQEIARDALQQAQTADASNLRVFDDEPSAFELARGS